MKVTREIEDTDYLWVDYRMKHLTQSRWHASILYTPKRGKEVPRLAAEWDDGVWGNNLIGIRLI